MTITCDAEVNAMSITFTDTTVSTRESGRRHRGGEDPLREVTLRSIGPKFPA